MHWNRNCWVFCLLVAWILSPFAEMFEVTRSNGAERGQDMKKFSENGQEKLKLLEGFVASPTEDGARYPTIGYGHKIKPGERLGFI